MDLGKIGRLFLIAIFLCQSVPAFSLDPRNGIAQYSHARWAPSPEFSGAVNNLAQDRRGFLWLSTDTGLYRFDGLNFDHIDAPKPVKANDAAWALFVASSGEVWTWYRDARRFAIYRGGEMHLVPEAPGSGSVIAINQARDGAIWAGMGQAGAPLLRFKDGRWSSFGPERGVPKGNMTKLVATADGSLWVSYLDAVLRLEPGAGRFETVYAPGTSQSGPIAKDRQGRIWTSSPLGIFPLSDPNGKLLPLPASARFPAVENPNRRASLLFDRQNSLWVNLRGKGIQRLRSPEQNGAPLHPSVQPLVDILELRDGFTQPSVNDMLEDRDGNIWIATSSGLDQLRDAEVVRQTLLNKPPNLGDMLLSASDGSVYVAEGDALYRVPPNGAPEPIVRGTGEPGALCEGRDGSIVFVGASKSVRLLGGKQLALPPPPVGRSEIASCLADRTGAIWITAVQAGWHRYDGTAWQFVGGGVEGDLLNRGAMVLDSSGALIATNSSESVLRVTPNRKELIPAGSPAGRILGLFRIGNAVIVSGADGLARIDGDRVRYLSHDRVPALRRIGGLVQSGADLWAIGPAGIVQLYAADLARAFDAPGFVPNLTLYGFREGLTEPFANQRLDPAVAGSDGRIWFVTNTGVSTIDTRRLSQRSPAPTAAITSVRAGDSLVRDPRVADFAPGTEKIQIAFTALALSNPERVKLRYKLEGFDRAWVDPGARREAFYTNLSPGKYRFRVAAAGDDGVWNPAEGVLEIDLPPTFAQSIWFKLLCLLFVVAVLWLLYRVRAAQLAARIRQRLEDRIIERERIARELHDTLLQSVQGLVLRFQSVADRLPRAEPAREQLEAALARADGIIVDGRNRVRDLRLREMPDKLAAMIAEQAAFAGLGPETGVQVSVSGTERQLQPIVAVELSRIAAEALTNIARHARATAVDIRIGFGSKLSLAISDNGSGFPEGAPVKGARDGHFGLLGMRERAERIGGTFTIASAEGSGTVVTITLPSKLAFADFRPNWFAGVLDHVRGRGIG